MNNIITDKYQYYSTWYKSMTFDEQCSVIGLWVYQRIVIFLDLKNEQECAQRKK